MNRLRDRILNRGNELRDGSTREESTRGIREESTNGVRLKIIKDRRTGFPGIVEIHKRKPHPKEDLTVLWYFEPDESGETAYEHDPTQPQIDKVIKEGWGDNYFSPKKMEEWVTNYWTPNNKKQFPDNEFVFPIPYKDADKMIHYSSGYLDEKALALFVENIDNPANGLNAYWRPFNRVTNKYLQAPRGEKISVFKLDPYFFKAWPEEIALRGKKPKDQNEYNVFKGYIEHKDDDNEVIGNFPYENLYLVGRLIRRKINGKMENCVVIVVGVNKREIEEKPIKMNEFKGSGEILIYPWKTDGPEGTGGGGAMP